ncbi:MAG TPA: hypothetical protein VJ831_11605, partial [Jatrophihabitantaceae bacterium]|nr:hypothetical protein [Jatrophihabitantaceae bacterium]
MTGAVLTRPASSPFSQIGRSRKVKNGIAATLVTGSFLVALIPLVWLLWTVVSKGYHVIADSSWWTGT